jgi:hypothetical protein
MDMWSLPDLTVLIGVSRERILWAEKKGGIPLPKKWNGRRVYDLDDVNMVRTYFDGRKHWDAVVPINKLDSREVVPNKEALK